MKKRITVAYFSPTGGTRRAALALAKGLGEEVTELDLSLLKKAPDFGEDDLMVIAGPVFVGRLPAVLVDTLNTLQGNGAMAVTAAVYGNRDIDDALLEFNDTVGKNGFRVVASAALVAQHSLVPDVAAGRPDEADCVQLESYGKRVLEKLANGGGEVTVPGNPDYRPLVDMGVTPMATEACGGCGKCAESCPTKAIPADDPKTTDPGKCILCMRCVNICPNKARVLPPPAAARFEHNLSPLKSIHRENELFL